MTYLDIEGAKQRAMSTPNPTAVQHPGCVASRRAAFMIERVVSHVVRHTLAAAAVAAFGAAPLIANANPALTPTPKSQPQTTPTPPASPQAAPLQLQTIIVTGTMIPRTEAETAEPITVLEASSIKNMGLVNVEQALNQVTSNVPSVNIALSVSTFTGGGSFANLRGLGNGRTLVLLDGHRLAYNVVLGDAVDLSGIPFSAIQSVQVLRDGASSLYGSDAIAGVINFITKKNYQGAEVEADINHPQENGGASGNVGFSFGHGDLVSNGYNFMVTASYSRQNELRAEQRAFAMGGYDPARGVSFLNGPEGPWPGSYVDGNGNLWQVDYPACTGNPYLTTAPGYCAYVYSSATDLIPESSELSGLVSLTKSMPGQNTLRLQYFYTRSKVVDWFGPETYGFNMTPTADPTYYPTASESTCVFNTSTDGPCGAAPDVTDPITAFWTDPGNNRYEGNINTEQRALLTFSGENFGWSYSANLNYSVNKDTGDVRGGEANEALFDPNGILSDLINPFGPQSSAGQSFIDSTYLNGVYVNGKLTRWSIGGHASHSLGDAFGAGRPAILAMGFDVKSDKISYASTPLAVPLFPAFGFAPTSVTGSRRAQALFVELDVPMAKSLDVDLGDREDRYNDFGQTNNGKVSVRYQPTRFVTFRGTASTGFRAPTLVDLYSPNVLGFNGANIALVNPSCASGNYNSEFTPTVCQSQGVSLSGGNTKLKPESSENFDFGVVVEPITNLGITLDYYRILLKDVLATVPSEAIYGDPTAFAGLYVLNSAGSLTPGPDEPLECPSFTAPTCGYILQDKQNTGGITTDGFDFSSKYFFTTPIGNFHMDLEGTLVTHFRLQEYTGGPQLNLVGWYNSGNLPAIRWQHNLRFEWSNPDGKWGGGLSNRFYSSYIDENLDGAGNQRKVANQSTWNAYASYRPTRALTVLVGVRNLFNRNPPFSNTTISFSSGYNPEFSNPILRTFYLNLKYRFL